MRIRAGYYGLLLTWLAGLASVGAVPRPLLADLDLSQGSWEMVAVSLYHPQKHPAQLRLGTFTLRDTAVLRRFQRSWVLEPMFDDYCDYHYALKFYQNRQLVKSLRVNLRCGYLSEGMFSYRFPPEWLLADSAHYSPTPWAMVQYRELPVLRRALARLERLPHIRVYQDVRPYRYDGFFVLRSPSVPWYVDRDSLQRAVTARVAEVLGSSDFYLQPYILFMNEAAQLSFRYEVFCSRALGERYQAADRTVAWRGHLFAPDDEICITYIGVNKAGYFREVYGAGP